LRAQKYNNILQNKIILNYFSKGNWRSVLKPPSENKNLLVFRDLEIVRKLKFVMAFDKYFIEKAC
jgi:hypothetical protein